MSEAKGNDIAVLEAALKDPAFAHVSAENMGPSLWKAIHNITRVYVPTPEKEAALKAFISSLAVLLPCSVCAEHFKALAPTVQTDTSVAALKWGIDVHNLVNKRLNKPVLTYAQAVKAISDGDTVSSSTAAGMCPCAVDVDTVKHAAKPVSVHAASSASNTGLWAGLGVAIGVAIICVVALAFVLSRRSNTTRTPAAK
jgi:hypothetical protein